MKKPTEVGRESRLPKLSDDEKIIIDGDREHAAEVEIDGGWVSQGPPAILPQHERRPTSKREQIRTRALLLAEFCRETSVRLTHLDPDVHNGLDGYIQDFDGFARELKKALSRLEAAAYKAARALPVWGRGGGVDALPRKRKPQRIAAPSHPQPRLLDPPGLALEWLGPSEWMATFRDKAWAFTMDNRDAAIDAAEKWAARGCPGGRRHRAIGVTRGATIKRAPADGPDGLTSLERGRKRAKAAMERAAKR